MNEHIIDQRAEAARAQLRAAVTARPIPPVGRVTVAEPPPGPRLGWKPLIAVGLVAACAVGAAMVLRDDGADDRRPAGGVPDARRVIDDLPEGFVPSGAFGPGGSIDAPAELWAAWWIADTTLTEVAAVLPSAPADSPNPMAGPDYAPEKVTSVTIDGHDASLFDSIEPGLEGDRVVVVQGETVWYVITARGIADERLIEIARAALDDEMVAGELPTELELLGVAPPFWALARTTAGGALPAGLCGVGYERGATTADGATEMEAIVLTSTPDTRIAAAQIALYFPGRSQVPGTAYSTAPFPGSASVHVLTWQIGGVSHLLIGTVSIEELVAAANSVRVPTDDEWAALVALVDASSAEEDSTGSSSAPAPATTAFMAPAPETTSSDG